MAALIPAAGSSLAPGYGHGTDQENPEYEVEATRRCARSGRTRPLPSQHWSAPTVQIEPIDHLVLTVRNVVATCAFYEQVLGPYVVTFGEERTALAFGEQKLDLHDGDHEFDPKATHPTPGAIDLCLVTRMGPVIPARAHRCARRSTRWRRAHRRRLPRDHRQARLALLRVSTCEHHQQVGVWPHGGEVRQKDVDELLEEVSCHALAGQEHAQIDPSEQPLDHEISVGVGWQFSPSIPLATSAARASSRSLQKLLTFSRISGD